MGRRKKGVAPTPTVHKQSGQSRVRIGNRTIWLGTAGSMQAAENYKQVLGAWGANGGTIPDDFKLESTRVIPTVDQPEHSVLKVGDLLLEALSSVGSGKTPKELRQDSRWWRLRKVSTALEPYSGMPAIEFGPKLLGEVAEQLSNEEKITKKYAREIISEIRRLFSDAVAREQLPPDRIVALKALKLNDVKGKKSKRRQPVSQEDIEATCDHLPPVVADLIRFIALTGCRPSEAMRATQEQFDTTQPTWVWDIPEHKTDEHDIERIVAIGPRCRKILKRWWQGKQPDEFVFSRGDLKRAKTSSTVKMRKLRTDNQHFTQEDLRQRVVRAGRKAGVSHWTPYRLRHTGLTEARKHGGLDAAQSRGGQVDSQTVEKHYAAPDISKQVDFAERYG